jgi:hypothetical protein
VEPAAEPHCGHQAVADLAAAVSRLCAAFISDRGAVQATIWRLFSFGASHGLPCVTTGILRGQPVAAKKN